MAKDNKDGKKSEKPNQKEYYPVIAIDGYPCPHCGEGWVNGFNLCKVCGK